MLRDRTPGPRSTVRLSTARAALESRLRNRKLADCTARPEQRHHAIAVASRPSRDRRPGSATVWPTPSRRDERFFDGCQCRSQASVGFDGDLRQFGIVTHETERRTRCHRGDDAGGGTSLVDDDVTWEKQPNLQFRTECAIGQRRIACTENHILAEGPECGWIPLAAAEGRRGCGPCANGSRHSSNQARRLAALDF